MPGSRVWERGPGTMLRGMGELFGEERIPSGQDKRARGKRLGDNGRSAECKSNLLCRPIRRIRQLAAALHRAGAWPPCCTERGAMQRVSEALLCGEFQTDARSYGRVLGQLNARPRSLVRPPPQHGSHPHTRNTYLVRGDQPRQDAAILARPSLVRSGFGEAGSIAIES